MPLMSQKDIGIKIDLDKFFTNQPQELFGHVTLVEGYALTSFTGCHALVSLRDTPGKTVAVLTSEIRLQSLLETALATASYLKKVDLAPEEIAPHADIEEKSDSQKGGDEGGAAVTEQRQGDAHHRQEAGDHAEVNEDLPEDQGRHPQGQEVAEALLAVPGHLQAP